MSTQESQQPDPKSPSRLNAFRLRRRRWRGTFTQSSIGYEKLRTRYWRDTYGRRTSDRYLLNKFGWRRARIDNCRCEHCSRGRCWRQSRCGCWGWRRRRRRGRRATRSRTRSWAGRWSWSGCWRTGCHSYDAAPSSRAFLREVMNAKEKFVRDNDCQRRTCVGNNFAVEVAGDCNRGGDN
jgi:hypothetical protein